MKEESRSDAEVNGVETYRGTVLLEDCDRLGHMTVQHYFRVVGEGMFRIMEQVGLGPDEILARRLGFAVVRAETDFLAELVPGEVIVLRTRLNGIGRRSVEFRHDLVKLTCGEVAMSTAWRCALLDLDGRVAVELPADLRERLTALFARLER